MRAVILEDEPRGLRTLTRMLNLYCPQVKVVGQADGVDTGVALFAQDDLRPDLAFLDIQLSDGRVFQLLERLRPIDFDIIFVTAFDSFAIKACEYACFGYILKPIDPDQLTAAVERVCTGGRAQTELRLTQLEKYREAPEKIDELYIYSVDSVAVLKFRDIVRLESDNNYTYLLTDDGRRHMASRTSKYYAELLPPRDFFKIHRSHVINMNFMRDYIKGTDAHVIMQDDVRLPVSRRRRAAFLKKLRERS